MLVCQVSGVIRDLCALVYLAYGFHSKIALDHKLAAAAPVITSIFQERRG